MADLVDVPKAENPEARHSSRTIKAQAVKLIDMTERYVLKRENRSKLENFVFHLKSQRLRNSASSLAFYHNGGVDSLLQLSRSLQKNNEEVSTLLGLVWGTLANLCALDERIQQKVATTALNDICEIFINCPSPKVLNTVCRTLGNLASCTNLAHSYAGNEIVIVHEITRILNTYKDSGCIQSSLRALRKLATNGELNKELRVSQTLKVIVNTLELKDDHISIAALKTLETITGSHGNCDLIPDLWSPDNTPLQALVQFVQQCSTGTPLLDMTITMLCKCAHHSDGKSALSRAGGIEVLVNFLINSCLKDCPLYVNIISALCVCCRDVQGRQKMRDSNGLQLLIELVHDDAFGPYHEDILSALICYYFDEHTLRYMVRQLNLMKSLMYHLVQLTKQLNNNNTSHGDSEINEGVHESCNNDTVDKDKISLTGVDSDNDRPSSPISIISCDSVQSLLSSQSMVSITESVSSCGAQDETSSSENQLESVSTQPLQDVSSPLYDPKGFLEFNMQPNFVGGKRSSNTDTANNIDLNLFAEDDFATKCSSATPTPPCKRAAITIVNSSTPIPANFIDSLLSSPTPYSPSTSTTPQSSSIPLQLSDTQESLESKILLLMSRLSHLHDCQPILAVPETLSNILQYFLVANETNTVQSFKILSRIFSNPLGFQDCINTHAPSIVFKQLYTHNPFSLSSPLLVTDSREPPSFDMNLSRSNMCAELFNNLCHVAESPYGQGVVAHMLLRGNEGEMTAGTLALSLFQRSHVVCHRMLTSYNGLHNLLCLSQGIRIIPKDITRGDLSLSPSQSDRGAEVSKSSQDSAIVTLLYLANLYNTQQRRKRQRTYYSTFTDEERDISFISPPTKRQRLVDDSRESFTTTTSGLDNFIPICDKLTSCRYKDTDHWPFDLIVTVDSKLSLDGVCQFPVHRNMLVESSEVFAVMLEGLYQESRLDNIHLYEMTPAVFSSYIHHIYGCQWSCKEDGGFKLTDYLEDSEYSNLSSFDLIQDIIKSLDSSTEKCLVFHWLLLLECANRYYMPSLIAHCEDKLGPMVSEDNIVSMFVYSCMHHGRRLSKRCIVLLASLHNAEKQCDVMRELLESSDASSCLDIIREFFVK